MYTYQKIGIKAMLTFMFVMVYCICTYAQTNYYPLFKGSGTGESSLNDFTYSHHTNYTMRIINLTVKWNLSTLFGEPVVDGVFKWKAASDTPEDYLDYRDYVLIQCSPEKSVGYSVYIKLSPTVPKSGNGYGYNTPGSPSWEKVFCTRKGEDMTREVPGFSAATAKSIWKNGFRVTGVVLLREGGKDGVLQPKSSNTDDFWNTPENTTTTQLQAQSMKQQEAISRQKQLSEQAKAKYNALKKPYSWNVNNLDTITEANIQFIKNLNPYFNNGTITLSSVSKAKVTGTANDISTNLPLAEGWNTLRIALKGNNYNLKDSVKVYYKKSSINHDLDGIWDRGDIEIFIKDESAVFSKIKTGDWVNYLNHGSISVGSLKLKNISKVNSNKWSCNELWKSDNRTFWNSATLELNTDGSTLILESQYNGNITKSSYTRK